MKKYINKRRIIVILVIAAMQIALLLCYKLFFFKIVYQPKEQLPEAEPAHEFAAPYKHLLYYH